MKARLCVVITIAVLTMAAVPCHGMSVSMADTFYPSYGQARHFEQYNEHLGQVGTLYDGVWWSGGAVPGGVFDLTISTTVGTMFGTGDYGYLGVWVDWDRDRLWTGSERVVYLEDYWFDLGTTDHLFSVPVPHSALGGQTWMRVRFSFDGPLDYLGDAWTGEVEDYLVNVIPEPTTWALLAIGLLGVGMVGLRRRI